MRALNTARYLANIFTPLFRFDLRALSLMRIGIGVVLLIDLFIRVRNMEAHYTNSGTLPIEALHRLIWNEYYFSFYTITTSYYLQWVVFLINMLCIIALIAGFRTRLFTVLCWLFLVSVHNRNPYIHQGGDDLLRLVLFWSIFLPWNAYYSIDRSQGRIPPPASDTVTSLAGFAYMLQVGYVYFFSALLKSSPEWTSEFTALYYALSLDQIVLPIGKWIYPHEEFLKIVTCVVYYIEYLLPFVLLIPFSTAFFRTVFIAVMLLLHFGISLCLNVGLFPMIGIISMTGLLPGSIARKIADSFTTLFPEQALRNANLFLAPANKVEGNQPWNVKSWLVQPVILFFMFYTLFWNLMTVNKSHLIPDTNMSWIGHSFRVDQHWGMFSPGVFKDDGWFIFEAEKNSGKTIDVLQAGREVTYRKLASVTEPFTQDRWRKFSENILFVNNAPLRLYYCNYLLNDWNKKQNEVQNQIKKLRIIYMKEVSLPGYKIDGPKKEILCECFLNK